MAKYSYGGSNVTPVAGNDLITLIAPSAGKFRFVDAWVSGQGTVTAANEFQVARSSGGTTGTAPQTAVKWDPDSPAVAHTNKTAWSAQPTLGDILIRIGCNTNGAIFRFPAAQGEDAFWRASDQLSFRCAQGAGPISWGLVVEDC